MRNGGYMVNGGPFYGGMDDLGGPVMNGEPLPGTRRCAMMAASPNMMSGPAMMGGAPADVLGPNTVDNQMQIYNHGRDERDAFAMKSPFSKGQFFMRGSRKRLNIVAILVAVFVPWLLFSGMYAATCFEIHYKQPGVWMILLVCGVLVVLVTAGLALNAMRQKYTKSDYEPSWYVFLFLTCLIAWIVAVVAGSTNYTTNMVPYYDLQNLNTYTAVDVTTTRGQQLMDAGRVKFVDGTRLDLGKSMGFKNSIMYCVAPIVSNVAQMSLYDFWAVGTGCCSGLSSDFHCGQFNNPNANGALRSINDGARPFYRLAVQQAEATFNIKAEHPIFFEWTQDPVGRAQGFWTDGIRAFFMGVVAYFVVQLFMVLCATMAFSKLVHGIV